MKKFIALLLFTLAPAASASFLPGPIQISTGTGGLNNVGYALNNSSVPVNIQNATLAVTQSGNFNLNNSTVGVVYGGAAGTQIPVQVQNSTMSIGGTVSTVGNVASGATDSGNPIKIGGVGRTTYQTAVTDGQRVDAQLDSEGKQVMMPYAVPALSTSGVTAAMTGVTDTVLISSGGASINTYINHILCTNSHATVSTFVNIKNGQTVRYTGYAVAAGGGFSTTLPTALPGASNSQWSAADVTTGANVICDMVGYFAKN